MDMYRAIVATTLAIAFTTTPATAKKRPEMSSLELQQIQTKDYEASKGMVFGSVMTVLQDSGYRIQSADKDTGLITGLGSTSSKMTWKPFVGFGRGKKTPVVSAFIEEFVPGYTKVRMNFVMGKVNSSGYGKSEDEEPILDPLVYRDAFEKIDQALFYRLTLIDKSSSNKKASSTESLSAPSEPEPSPDDSSGS